MNHASLAPVSTKEDYSDSWQALDENGDAIDLTGATIVYELRNPKTGLRTAATVTINTTVFTAAIPVSTMRGLCPGEYEIGCTIEQNSITTQFFVGTITIVDGIVT